MIDDYPKNMNTQQCIKWLIIIKIWILKVKILESDIPINKSSDGMLISILQHDEHIIILIQTAKSWLKIAKILLSCESQSISIDSRQKFNTRADIVDLHERTEFLHFCIGQV